MTIKELYDTFYECHVNKSMNFAQFVNLHKIVPFQILNSSKTNSEFYETLLELENQLEAN